MSFRLSAQEKWALVKGNLFVMTVLSTDNSNISFLANNEWFKS